MKRWLGLGVASVLMGSGCDDDATRADVTDATASDGSGTDVHTPDVDLRAGRFPENVPAGFTLLDLGAFPTTDGETEDIVFTVPDDAVTLHVVLVTEASATVGVLGMNDGSGAWVVLDAVPDAIADLDAARLGNGFGSAFVSPNKNIALPRVTTVLVPNTPRVTLQPGTWTLRAGAFDSYLSEDLETWRRDPVGAAVHVGVLLRTTPVPATGTIDLVLSFDPSSGLDAAAAETDADILRSLDILETSFATVGLAIGTVTYRDVSLTQTLIPLVQPACNVGPDIAAVFDEAPAPVDDAVHVIFLDGFTCELLDGLYDAGRFIGALSIGAPGVPFGTRTGVLASTYTKAEYPLDWSEILAHEVAHYLGLYHVREALPGIYDNIADTPEDEAGAKTNLMYPSVTDSTDTLLTPDQGRVLRSSPLVK